jgi:hypothetical protein
VEAAVDRLLAECQDGAGGEELRMLLLRLVPDYTPASAAGPRATPARGLTGLLKKRSA